MWLGVLASARGYREEIRRYRRVVVPALVLSVIGSICGAMLLLHTPPRTFERLIPWLLLFATVVFAVSPFITKRAGARHVHSPWQLALQFVVSIYGGYFGAGIGILMLAILSFSDLPDLNAMNGVKNLLSLAINGVAVIPFLIAGLIVWHIALLMAVFAMAGGYAGARVFRRLPSHVSRAAVLVIAVSMTGYFFLK